MTRELNDKWWLCPVSRRTLFVFSEALICLSYTAVEKWSFRQDLHLRPAAYRAAALLAELRKVVGIQCGWMK